MSLKEDLENERRSVQRLRDKIDRLLNELQEAKEELHHYRTAVSAVKWLWERAGEQGPFQL